MIIIIIILIKILLQELSLILEIHLKINLKSLKKIKSTFIFLKQLLLLFFRK